MSTLYINLSTDLGIPGTAGAGFTAGCYCQSAVYYYPIYDVPIGTDVVDFGSFTFSPEVAARTPDGGPEQQALVVTGSVEVGFNPVHYPGSSPNSIITDFGPGFTYAQQYCLAFDPCYTQLLLDQPSTTYDLTSVSVPTGTQTIEVAVAWNGGIYTPPIQSVPLPNAGLMLAFILALVLTRTRMGAEVKPKADLNHP